MADPAPSAPGRGRLVLWALLPVWLAISAMQIRLLLGNQPLGCDLLPPWTAGGVALQRPQDLYRFDVITDLQRWLIGNPAGLRPWIYPPSALLLFAPFAKLPFAVFYPVWTGLTGALFGWLTAIHLRRDRWISLVLLGLGSACCTCVLIGQASLLIGALLLGGLGLLDRRPAVAGVLLAMAALVKPTSLVLMPVALVAIGSWRTVAAGVLTAILAVLLSSLLFGWQAWLDWFHALPAFDRLVRSEPTLWRGVVNFTWLAHLAGASDGLVLGLRAALALAGAVLVWVVFRRTQNLAVRIIVMAGAGLLITPYAMSYDAAIVAAPAAILMSTDPRRIGWGFACFLLAALAASPPAAPFGLLALVVLAAAPSLRNLSGRWGRAGMGAEGGAAAV